MTKDEVHKIVPALKTAANLGNPFLVPSGYFSEIESQVEMNMQLNKISSVNEFSTPQSYFDTFEETVIAKLKAQALSKNANDKSLPVDYFDTLEDKVMERLNVESQQRKSKVISIHNWKKIIVPIAAAASIILLITLGNKQEQEVTFENLALSEIEYALESHFLEYDSETLTNVFPEVASSFENLDLELTETNALETYLYESDLTYILNE